MKVRLVKKEDLMKATNRANLVKVAVQVNGRTGQYSSHRWKNPGAALNVLKETMKRAGVKPTDELEFKNKKTKKTLNEDELIKDYKQSKTTDTLQDFVRKNYTVSKAKEEKVKEEKPKVNKKKKTYQEEKPKSEKQVEPKLEQAIEALKGRTDRKDIKIERENGRVYVSSPKDKAFIYDVKRIGGKWDPDRKQWSVRQDRENELRDLIAEDYGWDERENEYVVVKYEASTIASHNDTDRLGNIAIASREKRDEPVELSDNTIILKGEFPESSPSNKYPMVDADINMEFATILPKKVYDSFDGPLQRSMKVVWEGKVGDKKEIESPDNIDKPWFEDIKLEGSEKQNRWANDIRYEFFDSYKKILESTEEVMSKDSVTEAKIKAYVEAMLTNPSSRDWIDNRDNVSPKKILQKVFQISSSASLFNDIETEGVKETLPAIEGLDEDTEALRTELIETGLSIGYRELNALVTTPQYSNIDGSDIRFIENILEAKGNADYDYWCTLEPFLRTALETEEGQEAPIRNLQDVSNAFFSSKKDLEPKLLEDIPSGTEQEALDNKEKALNARARLTAKYIRAEKILSKKERYQAKGREIDESKYKEIDGLTRESLETARKMFETEVSQSYWNDIADKGVVSIQDLLKENTTEADLSAYEVIFRSHSKRAREAREARHKNATRVDSKGDYKEVANYGELKKNLSLLKDSKTEVVGRAAMDMVGLTSPLYVNKETPFILGGSTAHGYCEYDFSNPDNTNNVAEIGVVDYKENRQQSFKTSIHESMHGAFGNIKLSDGSPLAKALTLKNHEGMVEIIGQATTKAAYGDKYKDPQPSYLPFVVDTALRLRSRDELKGKSVHQIGEYLGEKAIAKDAKYFEDLSGFLDKNKRVGLRGDVVKELSKNTGKVETVAKKEHERSGKGDFEKSNLANLVEQMKAGLITLQGALNSSQYGDVAVVLLYRLLEEDEEAAETLSAFQ